MNKEVTQQPPEDGSVEHYRIYSGSFVNSFLTCYQTADRDNRRRLAGAFPQMAAAVEMDSWKMAPPNFPPNPFVREEWTT